MTRLFTADAVLVRGDERLAGSDEISRALAEDAATWRAGTPGALHLEIIDQPLVTLSEDGRHARGRWQSKRFLGDGAGATGIEGGLYENEYRLDDGAWRISTMRYFPLYAGDYATGWTNAGGGGLPIFPRHYTPEEAGTPIPASITLPAAEGIGVDAVAARIARLNAEDDVRNLQHAFGYYVDRRMWSDAGELFDDGAVFRIDGTARTGSDGVRQALETMGPEGLRDGILNDRVMFDVIVDVDVLADEATCHGIEVGLLGDAEAGTAAWEFSTFTNRFVRRAGIWRIAEMDVSRVMRADYDAGWGRGGTGARRAIAEQWRPEFTPRTAIPTPRIASGAEHESPALDDLDRRLARSKGYDGTENVSAAYGYYLDDFQWPEMAAIFAADGHKQSPFAGYYLGPDRILQAASTSHGARRPAGAIRERLVIHWRPQCVIMVSHDGRSANLRTRLFQTRTAKDVMPEWTGIHAGGYPNDQAVLEDGVWRLWSITIDEYYFASPSWEGGWAAAERRPLDAPDPPPSALLESCPPDIPLTELGERARGYRGGPGRVIVWPEIVPVWFHYRNPVSGRVPAHYWPDCVPSVHAPETSMTRHGYELPPTGPAIDGVDLTPERKPALT